MDFKSIFAKLDADPDFQRLSYSAQKEVRGKVAAKALAADPDFAALSPADQETVLQRVAIRRPAFEDPLFAEESDLFKLEESAKNAKMQPVGNAARMYVSSGMALQEMSIPQVATKVFDATLAPVFNALNPGADYSMYKRTFGADKQKSLEYIADLAGGAIQPGMSQMIGKMVDIGASMSIGRAPSAVLTGAAKAAAAAATTQAGRWVIEGLLPSILRTAASGAVASGREAALEAMKGQPADTQKIVEEGKSGALLDFGVNLALASIPYVKANLWIFGKGVRGGVKETMARSSWRVPDPEEYAEMVKRVATGAQPQEVAIGMHPMILDNLQGIREYQAIAEMKPQEFAANPFNASKVAAFENSMTATDLPDGRVRLRAWTNVQKADWGREGGEVVGEYDNIVDLNRSIAEENKKIVDATFADLKRAEAKFKQLGPEAAEYRDVEQQVVSLREAYRRHTESGRALQPYIKLPVQVDGAYGDVLPGSDAVALPERGALTQSEFSSELVNLRKKGVVAAPAQITPSTEQIRSLRKGGRLLETDSAARFGKYDGPDANALVVLTNPADEAAVLKAADDLKKVGVTDALSQQDYLIQSGYDGIVHTDGGVSAFFPRNQVKYVSDFVNPKSGKMNATPRNPVLREVQRIGGRSTAERVTGYIPSEKTPGVRDPRVVEQFGKTNAIRQQVRAFVPDEVLKESDTGIARILSTVSGDVGEHTQKIKKSVELLVERSRGERLPVVVRTLKMDSADKVFVDKVGGSLVVSVPDKLRGPYEQVAFTRGLLNSLDSYAKETAEYAVLGKQSKDVFTTTQTVRMNLPVEGQIAQKLAAMERFTPPTQNADAAKEWFRGMVKRELNAEFVEVKGVNRNTYMVQSTGMKPFRYVYDSFEDAVDDILLKQVSEGQLRSDLALQGFKLVRGKDGLRVFDGNRLVAEGLNPAEVMKSMNYRPGKIDGRLSPQDVVVVEGGVEFTVKGNVATGRLTDIRRFLDRFTDTAEDELSKVVARSAVGKISQRADATYRVTIPSFGIDQTFADAKSASDFLRGRWQEADYLTRTAADRGFDLTRRAGKWVLQNEAGTRTVDSLEEVGRVLKDSPDPSYAPEIAPELNVDVDLKNVDSTYSTKPTFFVPYGRAGAPSEDIGVFGSAEAAFRPQQRWIADKLVKSGRTDLADLFQSLQTHVTEMRRVQNETRDSIVQLFKEADGKKVIPAKRRTGIMEYMEASYRSSDAALREKIVKEYALSSHDISVAEACRSILGNTPTEGLNAAFGVSGQKFLFDYMPRYRKWAAGPIDDVNSIANADPVEVWRSKISGEGSVPKEVEFMSAYKRVADTVDFSRETDALKVMLRYTDTGYKTKYLNPVWKDIDEAMKTGPLNETLKIQMNRYREVLMGSYQTAGEKILANFGEALHKKLGVNAEVGRKMLDAYFTLNVLTTQAFRPWLAVRNVSQTYTTLGALMGVDYTQRAVKEVMNDPQRWVKLLQSYGIVTEAPPLVHELLRAEGEAASRFGAMVQGAENLAGKAAQSGLYAVKNGDDLTRAFAYVAARQRFDDGVVRLQKGMFKDFGEFAEFTNVNYADDAVQKLVQQHVHSGNIEAARHEFAKNVVDLTMYSYAKQNRPKIMDGVVGRLYGQYQVYPFNYVELVRRMATRGSAAQRIATVGRLVGIAGGIAAGLTAVGMEGSNFLPWMPASMSGGPLFNIAVNVAQATNFSGYQGRQARAELGAMLPVQMNIADYVSGKGPLDPQIQWPRTVPGFYQYDSLRKALKYAEEGNGWNAWLSLTGAPIRMDLR